MQAILIFRPFWLQNIYLSCVDFEHCIGEGTISVMIGTSTSFSFIQPIHKDLSATALNFATLHLQVVFGTVPSTGESSCGCDPQIDIAVVSSISPGFPG